MGEANDTWTFFKGEWHPGNVMIAGPRTHAFWLGSSVFDGARAFENTTPDLDLHCARVNRSARKMGLEPSLSDEEITAIARQGVAKFGDHAELYIRPMYWAEQDGPLAVAPLAESTQFCLCLYTAPMPTATSFSLTTSTFARPTQAQAPVDAKAGCLYPNGARVLRQAREAGFDNALVLDAIGNVAETATANIFMARDGEVFTPVPNGTFLDGITRQRVIKLLEEDGVRVNQTVLSTTDFREADEIWATGNYIKVMPCSRFEQRDLQPGPLAARARELYWDFAHTQ